jgi:serine/threonine protein kinase
VTRTPHAEGVVFGRYVLMDRLATGGMGEVYLALQRGLGAYEKPLAVKRLLPHLSEDSEAVQRFLEEAQLAARMNHANIVQVFDVGVIEGGYFIAMEFVQGVSLQALMTALDSRGRQLPAELCVYVARVLCDALQHAHGLVSREGQKLEVVHRDVSPQNVLISVDGAVKLTDFGIAKCRMSPRLTRTGSVKGKLEYVSPEMLRGLPIDRRADLFGLGATLAHMATLRSPFARDNDSATMRAVDQDPLPDLAVLRPELPVAFIAAVSRAVEKEPDARFNSARAMRDVLPACADLEASADALGALVRELCPVQVKGLEAQTSRARAVIGSGTSTLTFEGPQSQPSRHAAGRAWSLGRTTLVLLTLAGAGVFASYWGTRNRGEAPPVQMTQSATVPAPAVNEAKPFAPSPPTAPKPAARKTLPPARVKPGYLSVDATPWAEVSVSGRSVGETPLFRIPVEAGRVTVLLRSPSTGKSVTRTVTVNPGAERQMKEDLR